MSQSPILKALSSIRKSGARTLLMGGQACVFYGAAEFSRDLDLLVFAEPENLLSLRAALDELAAELIAAPPFEARHLLRGHAVYFRCRRPDVAGLRIDIMGSLRAVAPFDELWERRTTIEIAGDRIDLLAIEDLVRAKKTQRDKDWPMIRRLVEQHYFRHRTQATTPQIEFWLRELRTAELLLEAAAKHSELARDLVSARPAIQPALDCKADEVIQALEDEQRAERRRDREFWDPLKRELEQLRHAQSRDPGHRS